MEGNLLVTRTLNTVLFWVACASIAAVIPFAYFQTGGISFHDGDCYLYAQIAQEWLGGKRLYSEIWLDKPPLAYLFYLPSQLVAPGSFHALQMFYGLWVVFQAGILLLLVRDAGRFAKIAAGLILVLIPMTRLDFLWASSEGAANLFSLITLLVAFNIARRGSLKNWECILAGVATIAAFHVRQNSLLMGLVPAAMILLVPAPFAVRAKGLAFMAGGGLVTLIAFVALMAYCGDIGEYFETIYIYPRRYASGRHDNLDLSAFYLTQMQRQFSIMIVAAFVFTLFSPFRTLCCVAMVAGIATTIAPLKPFSHYYAHMIPVLALFVLVMLDTPIPYRKAINSILVGLLLVFLVRGTFRNIRKWSHRDELSQYNVVAEVINQRTKPGSRIFVTGGTPQATYLYFRTTAPAAHAYHWDMLFDDFWANILPKPLPTIFKEYEENPPELLAVEAIWLPTILAGEQVPKRENVSRLVANLLKKARYSDQVTVNGWVVFSNPLERGR